MSKESWYKGKPEDIIRINTSDDFIVDYDKSRGMYRVSYFEEDHFVDECWFDAYEDKEVDGRIDKILEKLEVVKRDFGEHLTKYHRTMSVNGMDHFLERLIEYIKNVKEGKEWVKKN